jgi:hypothetical protein
MNWWRSRSANAGSSAPARAAGRRHGRRSPEPPGFHIPSVVAPSWIMYAQILRARTECRSGRTAGPTCPCRWPHPPSCRTSRRVRAGAVHDHRWLLNEGRVAQQASKGFRRLQIPLVVERLLAHGDAVRIDDPHTGQQDPLVRPRHGGSRPASRRPRPATDSRRAAGGSTRRREFDGTVQVINEGRSRAVVPDVPLSAGPRGQQPLGDLPGGVVVRSVRHGDLDVLGQGRGRQQGRRPIRMGGRLRCTWPTGSCCR